MASDEEDDLEALRLAALASLKRKKEDSTSIQPQAQTKPLPEPNQIITPSPSFSSYQPVNQSLPSQSKPNQFYQRGRGNNRRPFRGGKGRGSNWNTAPAGPRSCLIVLTQEEPKKEALPAQETGAKDSKQPPKSKLLLPQDKWASQVYRAFLMKTASLLLLQDPETSSHGMLTRLRFR
uniref:Uncharacterized protein LOC111119751 n=1 Tax=Crassostrea virginica TaxID=6565 RepID=A0A8B8CJA5_CRAVI|nr:uncharacterized protein LOC111119751 [Crassostrea virginica]